MSFHKDLSGGNIHVIYDMEYADTTARDADTDWNGLAENIGKVVKVTAGPTYFILNTVAPTWLEITTSVSNALAGVLAIGNTSSGSDLLMSNGDTLDLLGTTSAMKLNRLTTTQRDALTPAEGMVLFNTTEKGIDFYDGTVWVSPPKKRTFSMTFGAGAISSTIDDRWLWPSYRSNAASNLQSNELGWPAPFDYRVTEISVYSEDPAGNGNDVDYSVRQNDITSAAIVTLASTGTTASASVDITGSQGDKISLIVEKAISITSSLGSVTVVIVLEEQ